MAPELSKLAAKVPAPPILQGHVNNLPPFPHVEANASHPQQALLLRDKPNSEGLFYNVFSLTYKLVYAVYRTEPYVKGR